MSTELENTDLTSNDAKPMLAEVLNEQLDKWVDDCNKQSELFLEKGMVTSEISSDAMRVAYLNVKTFIKDFS